MCRDSQFLRATASRIPGSRHIPRPRKILLRPPGPPDDPWGPYIREASERFDVPDPWIRAVMMRRSRGQLYDSSGNFTTSVPGAMGLLQLMPPTYDDMRVQYSLGDDPYDPHDNILAGTAYLRQMYDIYGSPGFLAAYNDGPGSLDNYLRRGRPLPRETRRYVAAIGPQIAGIWPHNRSNADLLVSQHDPNARVQLAQNTPQMSDETTQESNSIRAAWRQKNTHENADDASAPMQVAEAPDAAATAIPATASASPTSVSAAWAARGIRTTAPQTVAYHPDQVADDDNSDGSEDRVTAHEIPIGHRLPAQPIMAVMPTAKPQYRLALCAPQRQYIRHIRNPLLIRQAHIPGPFRSVHLPMPVRRVLLHRGRIAMAG